MVFVAFLEPAAIIFLMLLKLGLAVKLSAFSQASSSRWLEYLSAIFMSPIQFL